MLLFTNASVSPSGKVNPADIRSILKWTTIFFAAPALMYLAQVQGTLSQNHIVGFNGLIPNLLTIGSIEGWAIGGLINFFLKLTNPNP